jgi:hypothetical protein
MKKLILILLVFPIACFAIGQTEFISDPYTLSIKKKIEPPILDFVAGSVQFKDADGNNAINANEACSVDFVLQNTGSGDGLNLRALVKVSGSTSGLTVASSTAIDNCAKDKSISYSIPISSNMNTVDGKIEISIDIEEPNGLNPPIQLLEIDTKKFVAPMVSVVDFVLTSEDGSKSLELRKKIILQLLVQNTGQGFARNVSVKLPFPENVLAVNAEENILIGNLSPGETRSVEYEFILNSKFVGTNLTLAADISESYGKYATDWTHAFALNQALAAERMVITSREDEKQDIQIASLRSDVDKDIPSGLSSKQNRYALIIGNEDYSSKQPGLEKEVNVDFAANDARVFAEYAEKVLGYPKENIRLLTDATKGTMSQGVDWLVKKAQAQGDAEIIFYYSGHGLPEEVSKEPYLIPVDVSGTQVQNGLSLITVYELLAQSTAKKCVVVLDACFSGGARNKELTALKGVKVRASVDEVPGNILVLASSSGTQSSAVYKEKQHGYFTYFLLKNLKENKGQNTVESTMTEVTKNVRLKALDISKEQTPQALPGLEIESSWKELKW